MAFAQSFCNQNTILRINIMVVDDDQIFLNILSRMLEKSKYRDPSVKEIKVIAVKDPTEALSTLKNQRNNIDLIITDYYMPHMNGLQFKKQITQEIGNLPVIVMSSDTNKEDESLTCGAGFIPKPIKPTDLTNIYRLALTYKRNSTDGSCANIDGSRQNRKRKPNGCRSNDGESMSLPSKKPKLQWTDSLQYLFLQAIQHIGLDKAVPKKILKFMDVPYLTRENVASHLQKYRIFLRKVEDEGFANIFLEGGVDSTFRYTHIKEYDTSLINRSFYSKPVHNLGQSRLLSNIREPVRFNQMPYNYMNRSSTYEPHRIGCGSNLKLPIESNLSLPNQPSQNEEIRSSFEPPVMANNIGQTSQVLGFGQLGPSAISGTNFSNNIMSSNGSFTPKQPGPSHFSYVMQSFLNNENTAYNSQAYNSQAHANATTHPNLELPQLENINLYNDLDKTNEVPYYISNFQFDHNKQQQEEGASTKFELPSTFPTEQNRTFSLENDGDLTFVNINQGHSNGETSNTCVASETNPPIFNTNPNQNQEQDVNPDISDWPFLDLQKLADDEYMISLLNDDLN